ncbi:MAG: hypothetical protein LQ337_004561 [Flavoplaca oasis]|nr:MAG: hypothetical protein LQ337_004561 [Flavoplaca oasis]
MRPSPPISLFLSVLLPLTIHALDISFVWEHRYASFHNLRDPITATCLDHPPGVCCIPHRRIILADIHEDLNDYMLSRTTFSPLYFSQLGAGWAASGPKYEHIGCNGIPILRVPGTVDGVVGEKVVPDRMYDDEDEETGSPESIVFSASWVDLRTRFPVASEGMRYLAWQGVKRMVWETNALTVESGGVPLPRKEKRGFGEGEVRVEKRGRREIVGGWLPVGEVEVGTPRRWRYPSVYEINGTRFEDAGDGNFRSKDGRVLELKT